MVEVLGGRAHTTGGWSWLLKKRDGARETLPYTLCRVEADMPAAGRRGGKRKVVDQDGTFRKATAHAMDASGTGHSPYSSCITPDGE